jgi:hypothetical protein
MMSTQAVMAGITGNVVGCRNPFTLFVMIYPFASFYNLAANLVTQH